VSEEAGPEGAAAPIRYDRAVRLSPSVRRVTQHNPGVFTGPGTNTYLVGQGSLFIFDPGEERGDGHLERILQAIGGARVRAVIPTHGHLDHWGLVPRLAAAVSAPIRFFGTHPGFRTDQPIEDGEVLEADGLRLEAMHTPGHTADHLSFLLSEEAALLVGDHVMGWSTSVIAPPEGDLVRYLRSLERLIALPGLAILYPAHGSPITEPYARMSQLHAHREQRTRQAIEALRAGPSSVLPLVARIYTVVDPGLHPAAAQSLLAHLLALEAAGTIERIPGQAGGPLSEVVWRLLPNDRAR
jgi:glyoxylase-like metal-dependent hydrolase (beta-lactamase superfamily II)